MHRDLEFVPDPTELWAQDAHVLVLAARDDELDELVASVADQLGLNLPAMFARKEGSAGIVSVDVDDERWHRVVRVATDDPRAAGAALALTVTADAVAIGVDAEQEEFCEGWLLAGYTFAIRSKPGLPGGSLTLAGMPSERLLATARGVWVARDLANTPSNIKNPAWFANEVRDLCAGTALKVSVLEPDALKREGFGGILAVGSGSENGPRLVTIRKPGASGGRTIVLVGKGITYDSGGLSLKPVDGLKTMKTDMSGAAAVVGAMLAIASEPGGAAADEVIALLPLAENMPSGSAYRPGDIVTHVDGTTSQIHNTDAEGRIVLADALAYAVRTYAPDALVDIATLTGAATLGLSRFYGALYADSEPLARALLAAGESVGERVWRMPLVPEYRPAIDSPIADTSQTGADGPLGRAGSITAALFLQHFSADVPWAHLDIAGPARAETQRAEVTPGATGFGVRLLTEWLRQSVPQAF